MPGNTRSIKMKKSVVKKRPMYLKSLFTVVCSRASLQSNIYYYYFYRSWIELHRNQKNGRTSIKAGTNKMSCSVGSPKKISQLNDCPRFGRGYLFLEDDESEGIFGETEEDVG